MARKCEACGKGSMNVTRRVKLRGKYNPTVTKKKYPNLQQTTNPETGSKIKVCAKCLKSLQKQAK